MTESDEQHLAKLVERARAAGDMEVPPDDLWPAIRDRIERAKLVALPEPAGDSSKRRALSRGPIVWIGAAVAAAISLFVLGRASTRLGGPPEAVVTANPTITSVADSDGAYEAQTRILFNRLALERSLVRPEALRLIDHDLGIVDSAIAELDAAIARDPGNPVLRRLLASSYREKIDILKRVGNAE